MTATGVVLAGGESSRFGSPKLAAEIDGKPLLVHAIRAVAAVADEVIVAIGPSDRDRVAGQLERAGLDPNTVTLVHDARSGLGPLAGLAAALGAARQPLAIVVGGDMPRLVPSVLGVMLAALEAADAVWLAGPEGPRSLPAAMRVGAARRATARGLDAADRSGRSIRAMLELLDPRAIAEDAWRPLDPTGGSLVDIDTPADLDALDRRC